MTRGREVSLRGLDLRSALEVVLEDYLRFLHAGPEPGTGDDAKAFLGHHAACRGALAHVEALVKLGRLIGAEPAAEDAAIILGEARQALAATEEEDPHGEEEQC